ncbi:alpha/beta hydrolase family protein [Kribbella sp. VKM Ac-2527]|uniref:Alpha/beta hydrolase family protein n=1 Tax=Kribbella caucasensis TaxID=2512215 RepID=A0A4R6KSA3_9ACTN|nr:alpha/beta hydrolase [Kribbella sp. VKM Ac-2527]TDO54328.1 alpha/beta hydrolase family protein [Kribbella sp. VKM Ac-2527]
MTAARLSWIVLPGLAETPEEFGPVVDLLPADSDIRIVDPWRTPVTTPPAELTANTPVGLVGHSIGGLAALRWTLQHPDQVVALVLVDTSLTSETGLRWFYPGTRGDRAVRAFLTLLGRLGLPALLGPAARRLLIPIGSTAGRDRLPKATVRARYGTTYSWLLFWQELTTSWALAREVGELLTRPIEAPPTVVLVATGGSSRFTAGRWSRAQRRLAERLSADVQLLPDSAHLVHLDRPDAIASAVVRAEQLVSCR